MHSHVLLLPCPGLALHASYGCRTSSWLPGPGRKERQQGEGARLHTCMVQSPDKHPVKGDAHPVQPGCLCRSSGSTGGCSPIGLA